MPHPAVRRTLRGLHEASPRHGSSGRYGGHSPGGTARGTGRVRDRRNDAHAEHVGERVRSRDVALAVGERVHAGDDADSERVGERVRSRGDRICLCQRVDVGQPFPSASASEPADGDDEEFPDCKEANVSVGLSGFPEKIVAGSGWKSFKFNVKNTGKTDIEALQVVATAFSRADLDAEENQLFDKYAHFEYRNPSTGKWTNDFADTGINNGFFFGEFPLDAGQKVSIDLRLKIDAGAPLGDSLAIATGSYDTSDGDCFGDDAVYPFQILKPGSKPGDVGDAKPSGQKPPKDIKPQGEAKPIEVEGNLAETGSSSALPMISLVGGAAVVAGAGAIFVVRRRKAGVQA